MMSPLVIFCEECGAGNAESAGVCFVCHEPLKPPSVHDSSPIPAASVSSVPPAQQQVMQALPLPFATTTGPLPKGAVLAKRYVVIEQVGQGGFGVVYKARDRRRLGRLVAIKQINLRSLSAREMLQATDSYNRERTLLARLKNSRLPRLYAAFADSEHWYLVMAFIKGETLEEYLKRSPRGYLSVREALAIGIQLTTVLEYLHQQKSPIIFRDVKPANIMRTRHGKLYLIDFGIARLETPGQQDTGPLGSPGFAAPEQYGKARTTPRTDMYGLSMSLEMLMTGVDPSSTSVNTPPARSEPLPPRLQHLLEQMRAWDVAQRPKHMRAVRHKLQYARDGVSGVISPYLLAFVKGLALGSLPYSLLLPTHLLSSTHWAPLSTLYSFLALSHLDQVFPYLYLTLFCLWPFLGLAQLIMSIVFLTDIRRSLSQGLMGLGILLMLVLLVLGAIYGKLPITFPPL